MYVDTLIRIQKWCLSPHPLLWVICMVYQSMVTAAVVCLNTWSCDLCWQHRHRFKFSETHTCDWDQTFLLNKNDYCLNWYPNGICHKNFHRLGGIWPASVMRLLLFSVSVSIREMSDRMWWLNITAKNYSKSPNHPALFLLRKNPGEGWKSFFLRWSGACGGPLYIGHPQNPGEGWKRWNLCWSGAYSGLFLHISHRILLIKTSLRPFKIFRESKIQI